MKFQLENKLADCYKSDRYFSDNSFWVGDILLNFHASIESLRGRTSYDLHEIRKKDGSWQLLAEHVGSKWKGAPLGVYSLGPWDIFCLGMNTNKVVEVQESITSYLDPGHKIFGNKLNGNFLLLSWHSELRQWHIWTSCFGTLHVYYCKNGDHSVIGTFFSGVAQVASKMALDWQAISGLLAFGFFPLDRTYFEDVRILRPAYHYVFDEDGNLVRGDRYREWRIEPNINRSYDETVDQFKDIFEAVMIEQTREGRIAIPISGGLDSRCTVAALTGSNSSRFSDRRLWSFSYGYGEDSVETYIARQVASARRLPFKAFIIRPYLFDQLDHILNCLEGFQDFTQCRQAFVIDELAAHADFVIAAHWGDVWLDDVGLVNKHGAKRIAHSVEGNAVKNDKIDFTDYVLNKMLKWGRWWLLEKICKPHLNGEEPEEILREMVRKELEKYRHIEDPDFRVKAFKTDNWSFRWTTASLRMFQAGAFPRLPFYDSRMADFFCTVPSEFVAGRRLQIDYLKRYAPDLARIKWQVYDTNLYSYQHFNTWLLPKRALKKAYRVVRGKKVLQRNWEVQFLNPRGRAGLEKHLLTPGLKLHEFVNPRDVQNLLDGFYANPDGDNGYTVSMLLTFAVWLEKFGP